MGTHISWIKIADNLAEISFGKNSIAEVTVKSKTICLGKWNEGLFAFAATCPHASGRFLNGFIDALGNVVCPLHRYKFCMRNGRNVSGEGYYLKHWPVEIREDGIYIGFEKTSLFGLL